ncbi:hypothetical protein [Methylobacterium sp. Leaf361]|uniref:hypothetical protein n=1 Tax=Methylobacterium sp. Leaf361 TaxID=1736352 RepID=UPI0012FEA222|nr:hypothetical protein [Methylobacterium sp. Leaf361]
MNLGRSSLIALAACLFLGQAEARPKERTIVKRHTTKALKHRHGVTPKHAAERQKPKRPVSGDVIDRHTGLPVPGGKGGFATLTHRMSGLNLSIQSEDTGIDPSFAENLGEDAKLFKVTPRGLEADALSSGDAKRIIKNLVPNASPSKVDAIVDETKTSPIGGGYSVNVK